MNTFILIIFLSTSMYSGSGAAGISQEFNTLAACQAAGAGLTTDATKRYGHVMTWGCFPKGTDK